MKRILTVPLIVAMILFMVNAVFASPDTDPPTDWERYASIFLNGAHSRLIYEDIFSADDDSLQGEDTLTSSWLQRSWSDMATTTAAVAAEYQENKIVTVFGSNQTSLEVRFYVAGAGDTTGAAKIYFETATDTTLAPLQNPGGSNILILDGNKLLPSYDNWIWEDDDIVAEIDSSGWIIPMRIFDGDWFRVHVIGIAVADTNLVKANIIQRRVGG